VALVTRSLESVFVLFTIIAYGKFTLAFDISASLQQHLHSMRPKRSSMVLYRQAFHLKQLSFDLRMEYPVTVALFQPILSAESLSFDNLSTDSLVFLLCPEAYIWMWEGIGDCSNMIV
jgi:hypothetical protein